MRGFHRVGKEALFWGTLQKIRDDHFGPDRESDGTAWQDMTVDEVVLEMMTESKGHFDPRFLRLRLEALHGED